MGLPTDLEILVDQYVEEAVRQAAEDFFKQAVEDFFKQGVLAVLEKTNWREAALAPDKIVPNMERHQRKTISYVSYTGEEYAAYVAGCSYKVGITIHGVLEDGEPDETDYLHCLIGPRGKNTDYYPHEQYRGYPQAMAAVDKMLEEGLLDARVLADALARGSFSGDKPSATNCPF